MHDNLYDFSFNTVNDNLFVIFGTHKWFRILSPSLRALPLTGLEFSFQMKENGYGEDGVIFNDDFDNEIEMKKVERQEELMF
jgi:hypothetical protein